MLQMTGFEPRISDVGSDLTTNCATTATQFWFTIFLSRNHYFHLFNISNLNSDENEKKHLSFAHRADRKDLTERRF